MYSKCHDFSVCIFLKYVKLQTLHTLQRKLEVDKDAFIIIARPNEVV